MWYYLYMNGYTDEPIHEQFEYGNYLIALHWLPQWKQFEARLYIKSRNGMIELGKFVDDSPLSFVTVDSEVQTGSHFCFQKKIEYF